MKIFITGGSGFIGTNFIESAVKRGDQLVNFDIAPPFNSSHTPFWVKGNILDEKEVYASIQKAEPDVVFHLAARTAMDENTTVEKGFRENTDGTRHLLSAVKKTSSVKRLIITSSQFVVGPGPLPEHDQDFRPHTVYGQSKVETEKLTRNADLKCTWTIIRPTNVWGPYHDRYSKEFWKVLQKGLYIHPNIPSPTRSYAYVGNVVWQVEQLMQCPAENVHEKVFYVGDYPINIFNWISGFHDALSPRKHIIKVPYPLLLSLAYVGDGISKFTRKPFYITSSRLKSMTTDYPTPMDPIFDLFSTPPYTLLEGIQITADWYKSQTKDF